MERIQRKSGSVRQRCSLASSAAFRPIANFLFDLLQSFSYLAQFSFCLRRAWRLRRLAHCSFGVNIVDVFILLP